jgi:hypothetical protein
MSEAKECSQEDVAYILLIYTGNRSWRNWILNKIMLNMNNESEHKKTLRTTNKDLIIDLGRYKGKIKYKMSYKV